MSLSTRVPFPQPEGAQIRRGFKLLSRVAFSKYLK